jgi:hypothetical protein
MPKKAELPKPQPQQRGVVRRKDGTEVKRTTIYLPPPLAKKLAIYCATNDLEMSDVITVALEKYLH